MKPTEQILKFYGKELKTVSDIMEVSEALMNDLLVGAITPAEARPIQKELDARIGGVNAAIKTLGAWQKFDKLAGGGPR